MVHRVTGGRTRQNSTICVHSYVFLIHDSEAGNKVNDLPKKNSFIIKIVFNRFLCCKKKKATITSQISIIIFTILYPPKASGFCQTAQEEKKLRSKNEIVKAHSFFMSARLSDRTVVKSVSYADKHHTDIYNKVSVLRLLLSWDPLNYIHCTFPFILCHALWIQWEKSGLKLYICGLKTFDENISENMFWRSRSLS